MGRRGEDSRRWVVEKEIGGGGGECLVGGDG